MRTSCSRVITRTNLENSFNGLNRILLTAINTSNSSTLEDKLIVTATKTRRDIKILLCLSALVRRSLT